MIAIQAESEFGFDIHRSQCRPFVSRPSPHNMYTWVAAVIIDIELYAPIEAGMYVAIEQLAHLSGLCRNLQMHLQAEGSHHPEEYPLISAPAYSLQLRSHTRGDVSNLFLGVSCNLGHSE